MERNHEAVVGLADMPEGDQRVSIAVLERKTLSGPMILLEDDEVTALVITLLQAVQTRRRKENP